MEAAPVYVVANGLRLVEPYVFRYRMHCKARWFGRRLVDVLTTEYKANTPAYYKAALKDGRIRVNGNADPLGAHVLRQGDQIEHLAHRHEPPVADGLSIIQEDARVVVVDKPASLPMHPCGSYNYNTLTSILRHVHGLPHLHQVHRLDKLTSGLVLLAKSPSGARDMCTAIGSGATTKAYIARVAGDFPVNAPVALERRDAPPSIKRHKSDMSDDVAAARAMDGSWRLVDRYLEVNVSLDCVDQREGIYACSPGRGRPSRTRFRKLRSLPDGGSLVLCWPRTGRTHQIRLHLQWLGHPIANDPCYGGRLDETNLIPHPAPRSPEQDEILGPLERLPGEDDAAFAVRACPRCRQPPLNHPHPACIWLHALQYAFPGKWAYRSRLPTWATGAEDALRDQDDDILLRIDGHKEEEEEENYENSLSS